MFPQQLLIHIGTCIIISHINPYQSSAPQAFFPASGQPDNRAALRTPNSNSPNSNSRIRTPPSLSIKSEQDTRRAHNEDDDQSIRVYDIENDSDESQENSMIGGNLHRSANLHDAPRRGSYRDGQNRLLDAETGREHRTTRNRTARFKHLDTGGSLPPGRIEREPVDGDLATVWNDAMNHANGARTRGQSLLRDANESNYDVDCGVGDGIEEYACMPNAWSTPKGNVSLKDRHFGEEQGI
jgi:hypothetical protein